ncbi:MAG: SurA N-terminal domain-containing protein [Reichenbachiella sp.]
MALINTLRNKMGKVVVGLIGFSIVAFVGADLLGPNSTILGNNNTDIGEIGGETIKYTDFIAKQDEMTFNFQQSNRRSPSSQEQEYLKNQAWDALVAEMAFTNQFNAIGLKVSDSEIEDMVQGDNIHPQIKQAFTNPETGEFAKDQIISFLQGWDQMPPAQQMSWLNFERSLAPSRRRSKYDNLLIKTNYATEEEAKNKYQVSSATADVSYLYIPYFSVNDSLVSATDQELQSYLDAHEDEYQKEESKEIKYVVFDVVPSAEDTALILTDIQKLREGFISASNDSTFAEINSDGSDSFKNYTLETLPSALSADDEIASEGTVTDPAIENGSYVIYKMSGTKTSEEYTARASHILFKWSDESASAKATAKKEARSILRKIKGGASFADMAKLHGTDGTKNKGGDLGWFTQGKKMVKEFDDAVFAARRTGLLADVVETQFGYHIIDVTSVKSNLTYDVAKVSLELFISDDTRNKFYRDAETFALKATDLASLEATAKEEGIKVVSAKNVDKNARRITGLTEGRSLVYWAYNKASVGSVSEVFEINDQYIIAGLASEQEKGPASLASVKFEIEKKVKDAKKADIIIEKLSTLEATDLPNMVVEYGDDGAKFYNMSNLKLSSNSLQSVGLAPEAVGTIFSMEAGEKTAPFGIDNGVILIELKSKLEAPEISDYESYRNQVLQERQLKIAGKVDKAVKELADIKDDRYKFF